MAKIIWRNALTGGGDALDGVDAIAANLATGDAAFVVSGGVLYAYLYNGSNGSGTSSPGVISAPNGGAWELQATNIPQLASDPVSPVTNQAWLRTDTLQFCIKTATGTLRFEAFSFDAD